MCVQPSVKWNAGYIFYPNPMHFCTLALTCKNVGLWCAQAPGQSHTGSEAQQLAPPPGALGAHSVEKRASTRARDVQCPQRRQAGMSGPPFQHWAWLHCRGQKPHHTIEHRVLHAGKACSYWWGVCSMKISLAERFYLVCPRGVSGRDKATCSYLLFNTNLTSAVTWVWVA